MKQMADMEQEELDKLYKLYVAECARDNLRPDFKNFHIFLVDGGYIDG